VRTTPRARFLAGASLAAALAAAAPQPAVAAPYACEASAVRATILGQAVEPIVAGRGGDCRTAQAGGANILPALANAEALSAATALTGAGGPQRDQAAVATGGITGLRVAPLPDLGLGPVLEQVLAPVRQAVAQLPGALAVQTPGVPPLVPPVTVARVDVRGAVTAALDALARLPTTSLVDLQAARSTVAARCADGAAVPVGSSAVSGLRVLGVELPTNQPVERGLRVLDASTIDPVALFADDAIFGEYVDILPGVTLPLNTLRPLVAAALGALPKIQVPEQVARVKVTPAQQERVGGTLTQRALRVEVGALGQALVDLVVGEAQVRAEGIDCSVPAPEPEPAQTAADVALECTSRPLVLIDVVPRDGRVVLFGAAEKRYVGRTVNIFFHATGRRLATATVRPDGSFRTTAALPPRRIRQTNAARYQARIGRERSLNLKLARRMRVTGIRSQSGRVIIAGQISRPLARPAAMVEVRRRVTCRRTAVVLRFRPRQDGRFRISLPAPEGQSAAVYRLTTRVRKTTRNPKRFPTFTLPRAVSLLG
jgi:hypothetical protein